MTVLRPPWLQLARAAWIALAATAIVLAAIGILKTFRETLPVCTNPEVVCAPYEISQEDFALAEREGLPHQLFRFLYFAGLVVIRLGFILVGSLVFWRRSDDWVAMFFSLMLVLVAVEGINNLENLQPVADFLYLIANLAFGFLPFIFPDGRFVPRRIVWAAVPAVVLAAGAGILPKLGFGISAEVYSILLTVPWLIVFFLAVYAVVYRYRFMSTPSQRQQTKWAITGLLGSAIQILPISILTVYFPPSQPSIARLIFVFAVQYPVYVLSYLAIPAGIAFAILRYRLWDIDVLIRRTLQYTLLTGLLALMYFGGVVVLQGLLGPLTGTENSPLVTVVTTLGIAALFSPLRARVQAFIDRRLYRQKYDAERTIAQFAAAARDEVDMDRLAGALLGVVSTSMRPDTVNLWLRKRSGDRALSNKPSPSLVLDEYGN